MHKQETSKLIVLYPQIIEASSVTKLGAK